MRNRAIWKRVEKVARNFRAEDDHSYTLEEIFRVIWRGGPEDYRKVAAGPEGYWYRQFLRTFEAEEAKRART
jgi:hypothetical protein